MSNLIVRLFLASTSDPAIASIFEKVSNAHIERGNKQKSLMADLACDLASMSGSNLIGFAYKDPNTIPAGLRVTGREIVKGVLYAIAVPDNRLKAGKLISARRAAVNHDIKPFSEAMCDALGVSHSAIGPHAGSRSGMAMFNSVCGLYGTRLVFSIPFGGTGNHGIEPTIHPALVEIPESEFIAITKEGKQ